MKVLEDVASSRRMPWLVLFGMLAAMGGIGFVIAWSGKSGFAQGHCAACGKYSALNDVMFRYNIGMLVMRQTAKKGGPFCKGCIHGAFWSYSAINLTVGWFGYISFFVTPIYQIGNAWNYTRSLLLPSRLDDSLSFSAPSPRRISSDEAELLAKLQANRPRIDQFLTYGLAHEEIAERIEGESGLPRQLVLEYLAELEAEKAKDVA
jgi:hypothetical protein